MSSDWSKELLLFAAARVHDETLNNYVGSAHAIVNYDDRFMWCITYVPEGIETSELEDRCNKLSEFCFEHLQD